MTKKPNDVAIMISAASCLGQQDKLDDAVTLLQKAVAAEPKNQSALQALGDVYEQQKKYDLAIAQYNKMLEVDSKNQNTLRRLANVYDAKKDYKGEIDVYRKLVKLDPTNVNTAMSIPRLYDKMDQLDTAIAESKQIVDANPTNAGARQQYGEFLAKKKDYDGALAQYAEIVKNDAPGIKANGYYLTGGVQETMGKTDDAMASYKKCIELAPAHTRALDAIGKIYEAKSRNDEFYAYLKSLIEPGTDRLPYGYYALTMKKAKKTDEAVKTLEDLAGKHPDSLPIGAVLAQSYADSGAKDKAIEQYKKLIEKNKGDSWTQSSMQHSLGDLYKGEGKLEEAAQCYDASLKASGIFANTSVEKDLGDLYVKLGKKAEALETYEAYLRSIPKDEEVTGYVNDLKAGKLPTLKEAPKPGEAKPETKPAEAKPEAKPVEPQPAVSPEAKPAAPQPAASPEAKPAETQPAASPEAKPAETQPAAKPEAKPAEPATDVKPAAPAAPAKP